MFRSTTATTTPTIRWPFLSDDAFLEKASVDQLLIAEDDNTDPQVYLSSIDNVDAEQVDNF